MATTTRQWSRHCAGAIRIIPTFHTSISKDNEAGADRPRINPGEDWRQEFYARKEGEQGAKQRAFRRALKDLEDMSRVAYRDDLVWIIKDYNEN